ncbi:MAG: TIGR01440 family protein [Ruminococcaceae bacterium]|nr:TIGR01440 family protein [Oscillospiraceae bacterium]
MEISKQCIMAAEDLIEKAHLKKGDIVVVGCSTSEVLGSKLGTNSSPETAKILFESLYGVFNAKGIYVAAQCCEHLNRAVIVERAAVPFAEIVNVVPVPKAGGSFATEAYSHFGDPVAVEEIKADAGIDIGATLIGMHLKKVAVPVRLEVKTIGEAPVTAARTRPKFIGGVRANYDDSLIG